MKSRGTECGHLSYDLSGHWDGWSEELGSFSMELPGTLDTNGVGRPDAPELATRLTRLHTWEGEARFTRRLRLPARDGKRLFLEAERARELRVFVDGSEARIFRKGTLSTPYIFELTEYAGREVTVELRSDNRYRAWGREALMGASAVTDETQTNWNGILGFLRLRFRERIFIDRLRVYPAGDAVRIEADLCAPEDTDGTGSRRLEVFCEAFAEERVSVEAAPLPGKSTAVLPLIPLRPDVLRWDEGEGNLYEAEARLAFPEGESRLTAAFGVRDFGKNQEQRLTLNGRVFFLRGEANCCVFPEEGHPPVTESEWERVLQAYASYGVNCLRCHSWCPPDAAFRAADRMGMMLQPELSHWNFKNAFEDEESFAYYRLELESILLEYANHPSFVMLSLGNELQAGAKGHERMDLLIREAKRLDASRLYINASNGHYGERGTDRASDFYTAAAYYKEMLRATSSPMIGHLNKAYPSARHDYQETALKVLADGKPVFGFEVGQYEVLPEFSEISRFRGVTRAVNLELIRESAARSGLLPDWERYVEASGELALLSYREEVEAVLRTPAMSGLSLLGLQDFPGQGTALVGMLNSHLEPKPYGFAAPERFRSFFAPALPLLLLEKYTYEQGEDIKAQMLFANYGKTPVTAAASWRLRQALDFRKDGGSGSPEREAAAGEPALKEGFFPVACYENQGLRQVGAVSIELGDAACPARFDLEIRVGGFQNTYPIWVYPKLEKVKAGAWRSVYIAEALTRQMLEEAAAGGRIFLEPEPTEENMPGSIGGQFSTDFWSVGTFPEQEGGMGLVIDASHPALKGFPTETHSNWQWWQMASGRPMILPQRIRPVLTVPDSYSRMKHMGLLFEASYGKGVLLVSGMGLLRHQERPEARALLHSLLDYLDCGERRPAQEITREELVDIIRLQER